MCAQALAGRQSPLAPQHGLAEHRGLRFDTPDTPAQHTERIDHWRVTVGAEQHVRIGERYFSLARLDRHHIGEKFEIDLVNNARARRHHTKVC